MSAPAAIAGSTPHQQRAQHKTSSFARTLNMDGVDTSMTTPVGASFELLQHDRKPSSGSDNKTVQSVIPKTSKPSNRRELVVGPNTFTAKNIVPKKKRKHPRQCQHACASCKRSKVGCDTNRPCHRCVRLGRADSCVDAVHKRRGRRKLPKASSAKSKKSKLQRGQKRKSATAAPRKPSDIFSFPASHAPLPNAPAIPFHQASQNSQVLQYSAAQLHAAAIPAGTDVPIGTVPTHTVTATYVPPIQNAAGKTVPPAINTSTGTGTATATATATAAAAATATATATGSTLSASVTSTPTTPSQAMPAPTSMSSTNMARKFSWSSVCTTPSTNNSSNLTLHIPASPVTTTPSDGKIISASSSASSIGPIRTISDSTMQPTTNLLSNSNRSTASSTAQLAELHSQAMNGSAEWQHVVLLQNALCRMNISCNARSSSAHPPSKKRTRVDGKSSALKVLNVSELDFRCAWMFYYCISEERLVPEDEVRTLFPMSPSPSQSDDLSTSAKAHFAPPPSVFAVVASLWNADLPHVSDLTGIKPPSNSVIATAQSSAGVHQVVTDITLEIKNLSAMVRSVYHSAPHAVAAISLLPAPFHAQNPTADIDTQVWVNSAFVRLIGAPCRLDETKTVRTMQSRYGVSALFGSDAPQRFIIAIASCIEAGQEHFSVALPNARILPGQMFSVAGEIRYTSCGLPYMACMTFQVVPAANALHAGRVASTQMQHQKQQQLPPTQPTQMQAYAHPTSWQYRKPSMLMVSPAGTPRGITFPAQLMRSDSMGSELLSPKVQQAMALLSPAFGLSSSLSQSAVGWTASGPAPLTPYNRLSSLRSLLQLTNDQNVNETSNYVTPPERTSTSGAPSTAASVASILPGVTSHATMAIPVAYGSSAAGSATHPNQQQQQSQQ
jgi:Fungal Zn(2)-Cys(6) binuclear cluster domain